MTSINKLFYEKIGPIGLRDFGFKASIDICTDLKQLSPLINNSKRILEIGAGYGRVLDYLSKKNPNKSLIGLENCNSMIQYLNKKYSNLAKIIYGSVLDFSLNFPKPDLILWMWSGFGDLSFEEQKLSLKNIHKNSSENSTLIIDLPDIIKRIDSTDSTIVGKIQNNYLMN